MVICGRWAEPIPGSKEGRDWNELLVSRSSDWAFNNIYGSSVVAMATNERIVSCGGGGGEYNSSRDALLFMR